MCGRYASTLSPELMAKLFRPLNMIPLVSRFNIAPTQPVPAIWEISGERQVHLARWGLMPRWVKDPRDFPLVINARSETMAEKPTFRDALKHGRCILPASGYYEWHTGPDKKKQPYYITLANDEPLALAGLYSTWVGPEGEEVDTVATITVPANADLAHIHDRMPAILDQQGVDEWLNVREVNAKRAVQLALPLGPGLVKFHPVSSRVNSARIDEPGLIEAVTLDRPEPSPTKRVGGGGQARLVLDADFEIAQSVADGLFLVAEMGEQD
ncbi:SOS response-associated peptidase [Devosia algicola]|uniref:Abasic site processing protein n=1 Tax=Devosia algicola TaxID=3026418 RepID=A0ABY7YRS4_9HYPH|nr:SOS response-associated peptidase [Devosia algicola]WDR04028.1 SOS response-associated peptidase [Devosia algicola]